MNAGLGAVPPEPTFTEKDMDRETLLRKMNEAMDDVLVEAAASMMRSKLSKARDKGRGGWWNPKECTAKGLREAMEQHTEKGDPVDVMNLAAMVAVREMLEAPNADVTGLAPEGDKS